MTPERREHRLDDKHILARARRGELDAFEELDNKELGRELAAALSEISEEHRRIVLLRDVSGMSYSEIAEILEISEGTVKSRLARARIALRRILLQRGNILPPAPSNHEKGGETHE